ncbi:MAG: TIR domain-containing protein [Candidatus Paceibacterota bacterium]|jgi:hypothetical protein
MNEYGFQTQPKEKHNVFVSFHNKDQYYRDQFDTLFGHLFNSRSVDVGDIDPENEDEYIKKLIQEKHIEPSSVVFALYGKETHQRKHVDWEVSAALNKKVGGHKGLVIMLIPGFPIAPYNAFNQYDESVIFPYLHPRTAANLKSGYADLYYWPGLFTNFPGVQTFPMEDIIKKAFLKRDSHEHLIDNGDIQYKRNLSWN